MWFEIHGLNCFDRLFSNKSKTSEMTGRPMTALKNIAAVYNTGRIL